MRAVRRTGGRLSPAAKARLAAEIVTAYVRARREVRRRPLPDVLARARAVGAQAGAPITTREAMWLGGTVERTISRLPDGLCLLRSIVLVELLARRDAAGRLVLGVRPGEAFMAHAWVELEGRPVLPPGDFERLAEL